MFTQLQVVLVKAERKEDGGSRVFVRSKRNLINPNNNNKIRDERTILERNIEIKANL